MAGDWIKVEENTPDKPEVAVIAFATGLDVDAVMGKLIRVWAWASRNCHGDGVTDVTAMSLIDRAACHIGFAEAMIQAEWLASEGKHLRFPNFDNHISSTAKDRGQAFIRKQRQRRLLEIQKQKGFEEQQRLNRDKCHGQSVTYGTEVSRSKRDKNGTIETETKTDIDIKENVNCIMSSSPNIDETQTEKDETPMLDRIMKTDNPDRKPKTNGYGPNARAVLHMLNEIAGRQFRETDTHLRLIKQRLSEPGVEVDEIRKMIQRQFEMWRGTEYERFLRPETLFNATKFGGYYDDRDQPIKRSREAVRAQTENVDWVAEGRSW